MPKHKHSHYLVTFTLDNKSFAVPLETVIRVEQAVKITPVPGAPRHLMGIINHHGSIVPVLDLRYKLGLECRPVNINDQLLLVQCHNRSIVLTVDSVEGVKLLKSPAAAEELLGSSEEIKQIMLDSKKIILITSPDELFKSEEIKKLPDYLK